MNPAKRFMFAGVILSAVISAGCISPVILADQAGFVAGTGYLVVNTPPADEIQDVKKVVEKIATYTVSLDKENTFASLYGAISLEITQEFQGSKRILALGIARTVLDGLDVLFAANPKWTEKKDLIADVTKAFVKGAVRAFDLFATDEGMRANVLRIKTASSRAYGSVTIRSP